MQDIVCKSSYDAKKIRSQSVVQCSCANFERGSLTVCPIYTADQISSIKPDHAVGG